MSPYLNFVDQTAEALAFYQSIFGGEVRMPFAQQMWGDHYGQLVDPFGITWSVKAHVAA